MAGSGVQASAAIITPISSPEFSASEARDAFAVLSKVTTALIEAGVDHAELLEFWRAACSSDFDNMLAVVVSWVDAAP